MRSRFFKCRCIPESRVNEIYDFVHSKCKDVVQRRGSALPNSTGLLTPPARDTKVFVPELVYFEPDSLNYPKGQRIYEWANEQGLPIRMTTSHNRITDLPGESDLDKYRIAKRTLVVGIRKTLKFDQS